MFQGACSFLDSLYEVLNRLDFVFFEVRFTALRAYPRRHLVEKDVAPLSVYMKRGDSTLHLTLAVQAFHFSFLVLKSRDHSTSFGRYAVMIAKYSPFGAQTT